MSESKPTFFPLFGFKTQAWLTPVLFGFITFLSLLASFFSFLRKDAPNGLFGLGVTLLFGYFSWRLVRFFDVGSNVRSEKSFELDASGLRISNGSVVPLEKIKSIVFFSQYGRFWNSSYVVFDLGRSQYCFSQVPVIYWGKTNPYSRFKRHVQTLGFQKTSHEFLFLFSKVVFMHQYPA